MQVSIYIKQLQIPLQQRIRIYEKCIHYSRYHTDDKACGNHWFMNPLNLNTITLRWHSNVLCVRRWMRSPAVCLLYIFRLATEQYSSEPCFQSPEPVRNKITIQSRYIYSWLCCTKGVKSTKAVCTLQRLVILTFSKVGLQALFWTTTWSVVTWNNSLICNEKSLEISFNSFTIGFCYYFLLMC